MNNKKIRKISLFQKKIIQKYQNKCSELGYKYVEKFREKNKTKIKCICNNCRGINIFRIDALMDHKVSCKNCLEIKYKNKCNDNDYRYVKKDKSNIICICNDCEGINIFHSSALMNGETSCSNCLELKYKNKCVENGYRYVEKFREKKITNIKCTCNVCGEINNFDSGALIKGYIRCSNCLVLKYKNKCSELGYKYVERDKANIKCICNDCGEINIFQSSALMGNAIKCKGCEKKTFVEGFIYKLTIGSYYYIGLTDTTIKNRYTGHKTDCFNKRNKKESILKYNMKIYRIIREELCRLTKGKSIDEITPKDFKKYVIVKQVAVIKTSREDLKALESELINIDNCWCLNSIN